MPSYIGHSVCGKELLKHLHVTDDEKTRFIIGNLIPDIKQVDIDYTLDEFINKKNIQKFKRITHFRKETNFILEYPHCRIFLEKYKKEVQEHIETLAYFFHLYTDHYYFKFFLPEVITFLDADNQEVEEKDHFTYVKIKKNGNVIKARSFFSKLNEQSLYEEYTRSNSYLIRKYKLDIDTDYLRDYLDEHEYNCYVEEINLSKIYDVFNRIDKVYDRINDEEMLVFEEKQLDEFVSNVVQQFLEEYKELLKNYL